MGPSRYLIAYLVAFLMGLFLGDLLMLDYWWFFGASLGLLAAIKIFWQEKFWRLGLLIALGLVAGLGYYGFYDARQKAVVLPYDEEIVVEGPIVNFPAISGSRAAYIIKYQGTKIELQSGRYPEYQYGDILKFQGTLKKPSPYLFHQGVLGQINGEKIEKVGFRGNFIIRAIYNLRGKFEESLNRSLSEPYAAFAAGLILGSRSNISETLTADFNRTGTSHIVAVSGYNVTIVIVYVGVLLGLFSRSLRFWGSLVFILIFVIMTGAVPSVLRAGILAALVALGQFGGRRINMTILLLLVAFLMLLFNPYLIKYDISFELSFLAFVGLVYLSSPILEWPVVKSLPPFIRRSLAETSAAQILVLPILIFYFGRVSLVAPIVNVLILWLIPLSMFLVFLTGAAGFVWLSLGQAFGLFTWFFLKYIIVVVESFAKIPWASFQIKTSDWWWMVIFYGLLAIWIFKVGKKNQNEF